MNVDLIVRNGYVFNAYFKRFDKIDIIIDDGKFYYLGHVDEHKFRGRSIDATGKYIVPGLIDCHMHIESSMTTPSSFSNAVLKYGVTTVIAEPHEIANVFGIKGIEAWLEDAAQCQLDIRLAIPSSVPSTNTMLETTGGAINEAEVTKLLQHKKTICLGEIMNCRDLLSKQGSKTSRLISLCKGYNPLLPIEGHCPAFMDFELAQIIYNGVTADHTEQTPERIEARISNGMFVQLQNKTLRKENIDFLKKHNLFEHFAIVTDDTMPHDLAFKGHLDVLVRKAISLGLTPEEAIYVTTFTPARRMNLLDKGAIAPGKVADFLILSDINSFSIEATYRNGVEVYNRNQPELLLKNTQNTFPKEFFSSVHVDIQQEDDFTLHTDVAAGVARCKIMCISDGTTFIKQGEADIPIINHEIQWEDSPYALAMVCERYGKNGNKGYALIGGNVLSAGAAATTYAHDHHNLLIVGQSKKDMVVAANEVIKQQGGYCVAHSGEIKAFAHLPIGGILYDGPVSILGEQIQKVADELGKLGYTHANKIMSLSTLALPVSPYIKVTDRGLIDVQSQKVIPLYKIL